MKVHVLTEHAGYEDVEILGVFVDRHHAFAVLEARYDEYKKRDRKYDEEVITDNDRRGWILTTGDYEDCVELLLFVDQEVVQ